MIIPLPDLEATENLAARLVPWLGKGDVLALYGELGAGKTTFTRALLAALGIQGDVPSPTFTLMQSYDTPAFVIHHFDFYRLLDAIELEELGWEDACAEGLVLVEWPDKAELHLPRDYLALDFIHDKQGRRVKLTPTGDWKERLKKVIS